MESQISMFMVQSGPIRRSLVALSTRTVAEDEEDDDAIIIFLSLSKSFPPSKILRRRFLAPPITEGNELERKYLFCKGSKRRAELCLFFSRKWSKGHFPEKTQKMNVRLFCSFFFPLFFSGFLFQLSSGLSHAQAWVFNYHAPWSYSSIFYPVS